MMPTSLIVQSLSRGTDPRVDWACRHFDAEIADELREWKRLRLLFRRLRRHAKQGNS